MFLFSLLSLLLAGLVTAAPIPRSTNQWFTVEWDAPEFVAISGDFIVPNAPGSTGIASVWPGLQGDNGVLQAELSSHSGAWTLGNSFYGLPDHPLGPRFQVLPGDTVHFSFTLISNSGSWLCTLVGTHTAEQTLTLPANNFNRALFAVELTGVRHDFTVLYSDVVITAASTPATEWCRTTASNGYSSSNGGYTVKDATAEGTTCHIGQIILPGTS